MTIYNIIPLGKRHTQALRDVYQNHEIHEIRRRAHLVLMRSRGVTVKDISIALECEKKYIKLIFDTWYYLGPKGILEEDYFQLIRKISIEKARHSIVLKLFDKIEEILIDFYDTISAWVLPRLKGVVGFLRSVYNSLAKFFIWIWSFVPFLFLGLLKLIKSLNIGGKATVGAEKVFNVLKIGKNSSHNFVIQLVNKFEGTGSENVENLEKIVAGSVSVLRNKLFDLYDSGISIQGKNSIINIHSVIAGEVNKIRNKEVRKRLLMVVCASLAAALWFGIYIQNGLVILTIFGVTVLAFNYAHYFRIIQEWFEETSIVEEEKIPYVPMSNCPILTEIGPEQLAYMASDTLGYYENSNLGDRGDERRYLYVAKYDRVNKAIFQRDYLRESGIRQVKLLEASDGFETNYLVSIGDYNADQLVSSCSLVNNWQRACGVFENQVRFHINSLD